MKCSRCDIEIGKKDPFIILYVRGSNGQKADCALCKDCIYKFSDFMNPNENTSEENKEESTQEN